MNAASKMRMRPKKKEWEVCFDTCSILCDYSILIAESKGIIFDVDVGK